MKEMYLVVVRTTMDELPILLTDDADKALNQAKSVTKGQADRAARIMGVDYAGRVCTAIIRFSKTGRLSDMGIIKDMNDEYRSVARA